MFSSSPSSLIIQLVLPGQPLALAALQIALRELCLHADIPISGEGSSGQPQPSSAPWPKDRKLRDGRNPERPRRLVQCPWLGRQGGESRSRPSCLLLQVEGEAKLCPSTPICSGGARSTARPLTTLRSARRTSRCSSWKCGAFKTPRSHGGQPLAAPPTETGTPRRAGCHPGLPAAVSAGSAAGTSAHHPPLHSQPSW